MDISAFRARPSCQHTCSCLASIVSSRFVFGPCVRYDYISLLLNEKRMLCCYVARDTHFSEFIALSGPLKFDHTVQ